LLIYLLVIIPAVVWISWSMRLLLPR